VDVVDFLVEVAEFALELGDQVEFLGVRDWPCNFLDEPHIGQFG
jgi:hypothetical protein